eukprot:9597827-Prorocentrum_lima.AAC.1
MTSSLVGSEMCIRDSFHAEQRRVIFETQRPISRLVVRAVELLERPCCPVSYTHLTLPTICSV